MPRRNIGADSRGQQSNFTWSVKRVADTASCDDGLFMANMNEFIVMIVWRITVHPPGACTAGLGGVSEEDQGTDVVDVPGNDVPCHCHSPAREDRQHATRTTSALSSPAELARMAVDQADSWQCDAMRLRCEF
jgi:hypothetical protein